jgi:enterochelin esterase-like enzyme
MLNWEFVGHSRDNELIKCVVRYVNENRLLIVRTLLFLAAFVVVGCQAEAATAPSTVLMTPTTEASTVPTVDPPPSGEEDAGTPPLTPSPMMTNTPEASPTPLICPYLRGRTETGAVQSEAMGETVHYLVHLPPCYAQYRTRAFPVVYLFHGWPMDEWHWMNLGMGRLSDDWSGRELVGPMIIVMPGVDKDGLYVNSSGGPGSFEGFVVAELVPLIDAQYRTWHDPEGRAVGGISRGAVWALEIAMRHQDVFGRVGAHSPALALNRPLPQYDPYRLASEDMSGLQFYLDAGDADWARAGAISLRDLLQEKGLDVTYQVHEGGHVDEMWQRALPDSLTFYAQSWPRSYEALPSWSPPEQSGDAQP